MIAQIFGPLEGDRPSLRLDATISEGARSGGRIFSVAVTIATGVNSAASAKFSAWRSPLGGLNSGLVLDVGSSVGSGRPAAAPIRGLSFFGCEVIWFVVWDTCILALVVFIGVVLRVLNLSFLEILDSLNLSFLAPLDSLNLSFLSLFWGRGWWPFWAAYPLR
jgi:hypothetical protein